MKIKTVFKLDEEKKHSRRYKAVDEDFPIKTIYVLREYADGKDEIEVTLDSK